MARINYGFGSPRTSMALLNMSFFFSFFRDCIDHFVKYNQAASHRATTSSWTDREIYKLLNLIAPIRFITKYVIKVNAIRLHIFFLYF